MKIGNYVILFNSDFKAMDKPVAFRKFLFFWIVRKVDVNKIDTRPHFKPGMAAYGKGKTYRYIKMGKK